MNTMKPILKKGQTIYIVEENSQKVYHFVLKRDIIPVLQIEKQTQVRGRISKTELVPNKIKFGPINDLSMEWLVRTLNKSQTVLSVDKDKYFVIFSKKEPYKKYRTKKLLSTLKYYEKETARLNKQLSEVQTYKKETEKDLADIKKL
jgi:hypothetical protein